MKLSTGSALALVFSLTLAACAGPAEEQNPNDTAATATEAAAVDAATTAASDAASDVATTAASDAASAAPSAAPSAAASATPAPAPAAAMAEPAAFAVCKACHSVDPGKNGIGPSLAGIWGEKAGAVPGFTFSDAMIASGLTWNQGTLDRYLTDPRGVVPGTKMAFGGVKDAAKRAEIIAYIRGL